MSALPLENYWTADEYLAWESMQPTKHELIDNYIVAMAGASRAHSLVVSNITVALGAQLRDKPCEVHVADMRVQVDQQTNYVYPDVVVVCGEPKFRDDTAPETLLNPTLIFEVLSPSTEIIDRNSKLHRYLRLPSLEAYFLVAQDKARIESYMRQGDGWGYQDWEDLDAAMPINAIDARLSIEDVYLKVQFPPPQS